MSEETNITPTETPAAPAVETDATPNATTTPAPAEGQQEGSTPTEPTPAEVAKQMQEQYTLKAEETPAPDDKQNDGGKEGQEEEAPFCLEFSEGTTIDEGLVSIATEHFKGLGVDGKAAGACVENIISAYQEQHYLQMAKNDAELKMEWGADYGARKLEVEQFLRAFCASRDYSLDRVSPISSPDGYRLVYEIMEKGGLVNATPAGLGRTSRADDMSWFKQASTPGTPEYSAVTNTSDRKAWIANNERYNRIQREIALSR